MLATLSRARGPPPLRRPLSPIPFCVWRIRLEPGMDLGRPGERPRAMGSRRDRRAVAHSGWGPVDHARYPLARARPAAADSFLRLADPAGEPGMDLGRPGRAAASYGVSARSPGCCAQRLGV